MANVSLKTAQPDRDALEAALLDALGAVNADTLKRVLDALGDPPDPARLTPELWAEIEVATRGALQPALENAFLAAAEAASADAGISIAWDTVNVRAADWARQYSFDLVRGINDNSRTMLQQTVSSFLETPTTNAALQEKIARVFGASRAENIAVTEITRAATEGERTAVAEIEVELRQSGLKPVAIWLTANDSLTCPVCGPRNGKRQGDGWEVPPPAHPRCRCAIRHEFISLTSP